MTDEDEEVEWILIGRYSDPIQAQMARDFLADHDVPAVLRGNSVTVSLLNGIGSLPDIRLMVQATDVDHAREVLDAMVARGGEQPYRGPTAK